MRSAHPDGPVCRFRPVPLSETTPADTRPLCVDRMFFMSHGRIFASQLACLLICAALAVPARAQAPEAPGAGGTPGVERVYVLFQAPVTEASVNELVDDLLKYARSGVPEVDLLIATPGGELTQAVTAFHVLRAQPFKLVTWNVGEVASAGVVLFLAGEERYAAPHATFAFHEPDVAMDLAPDGRLDEAAAGATLERLKIARTGLVGLIADATGMAASDVDGLLRSGATLDAESALARHLVSAVREPAIPADNPVRKAIH
jgi:ATP-dependent Clp protease protease subunit